ncbi:hypothetical protein [Photobacterium sanguinicancri]|uniref:hypothetical protein n=1 Tax=Photobacterium sanguinicancri TaxID=875932 RepID=UPI0026E27240|nr:hypothetical protein [Photobacterium sanguinicancri]MDO6497315.1 hypothetical protein [Photobacterium sanguinicancri]
MMIVLVGEGTLSDEFHHQGREIYAISNIKSILQVCLFLCVISCVTAMQETEPSIGLQYIDFDSLARTMSFINLRSSSLDE